MKTTGIKKALETKERIEDELLRRPGVHGVSIGPKRVNGEMTDDLAITVHVSHKRPLAEIPEAERVPPAIDGIRTDVLEHEQLRPMQDTGRYRPLLAGAQLAFSNWVGTLGAFANMNSNGAPVILSNQHVLPTVGGEVFQPNNHKNDKVGIVSRAVLSPNVDGAIATINADVTWSNAIIGLGVINGPRTVTWAELPVPVRKRGRTTFLTAGRITNLAFSGVRTDGWVFRDQQYIEPTSGGFCAPGDSGSAVVDANCRVVGLLWGGTSVIGAASPIAAVQSELGIRIMAGGVGRFSEPLQSGADLQRQAQEQLVGTVEGQRLILAWEENKAELEQLVHHNKRVAAIWKRSHGDSILTAAANYLHDGEMRFPERIGGQPARAVLEQVEAALLKYGSDKLKADLARVRPSLERAIGQSFQQTTAELREQGAPV